MPCRTRGEAPPPRRIAQIDGTRGHREQGRPRRVDSLRDGHPSRRRDEAREGPVRDGRGVDAKRRDLDDARRPLFGIVRVRADDVASAGTATMTSPPGTRPLDADADRVDEAHGLDRRKRRRVDADLHAHDASLERVRPLVERRHAVAEVGAEREAVVRRREQHAREGVLGDLAITDVERPRTVERAPGHGLHVAHGDRPVGQRGVALDALVPRHQALLVDEPAVPYVQHVARVMRPVREEHPVAVTRRPFDLDRDLVAQRADERRDLIREPLDRRHELPMRPDARGAGDPAPS